MPLAHEASVAGRRAGKACCGWAPFLGPFSREAHGIHWRELSVLPGHVQRRQIDIKFHCLEAGMAQDPL